MLRWLNFSAPSRRRTAAQWHNQDVNQAAEVLEIHEPPASLSGSAFFMHEVAIAHPQTASPQPVAQRKATAPRPDMTGHWRIVTDFGDIQINSSMDLVQHGRKIKGTLTNDGQSPGKVKGKVLKSDSKSLVLEALVLMDALNPVINSNGLAVMQVQLTQREIIKSITGSWKTETGPGVPVRGTCLVE